MLDVCGRRYRVSQMNRQKKISCIFIFVLKSSETYAKIILPSALFKGWGLQIVNKEKPDFKVPDQEVPHHDFPEGFKVPAQFPEV